MFNSKINRQQFKVIFLVQGIVALFLATGSRASAAIEVKDTNYPIPSNAYFVASYGSASNSGKSVTSPWSVAKAIESAPAGSTIVFRGGIYRSVNDLKFFRKLTLQAYPHEEVWIKGSNVVTGWVADGNIWRKDGWIYSFPPNVGSEFIDPDYPMAGYRDMVYVDGAALEQVASKAAVGPGQFYVDSKNDKLYIGDNPAGKSVEATAREEAFGVWEKTWSDPAGTVIRGLGFAHYAEHAVIVGASHTKIEDNTFVWNGTQGLRFSGQSGEVLGVSTDGVVRGNTFSYNGRRGLGGSYVHRMLLENNTITYNNVERFEPTWDAAGVKVGDTDWLVWRNNTVANNYATGMWVDVSSTNSTIVKNVVHNNQGLGIFFEVSHMAILGGNVAYNNKWPGIMVSNSTGTRVYNNTLANNGGANLQIKDSKRNNADDKEIDAGITWISRNHVVRNNILSNTTGGSLFDLSNCDTLEKSVLQVNDIDYNAYYRTSGIPKVLVKWSLGKGKCSTWYNSTAEFASATTFEDHALDIKNVATNPFFVDEKNKNFNLKSGSSAIGRGALLPADVAKALGLKAGVKVDMGAFQAP